MGTFLLLEFRKLKGTLAALLCLVAPTLVAVMTALIASRQAQAEWRALVVNAEGLWAYFVLPMTVTALSALIAQIEHGPKTWDHLLALPISRAKLFAAKAVAMMTLLAAMSLLLLVETWATGSLLALALPKRAPTGGFPWSVAGTELAMMWAASWFMGLLQLWIALRFKSFVAPLTVGLAGTFVVVAAMGAPEAIVVPWVMPISVLGLRGIDPLLPVILGLGGGVVTLVLMIADLSRREV
jgi:ABC-2 type transport system permease protein